MAWDDFLRKAGNAAYELSGVGDIKRGVQEIAKGNIAGGIGRVAMGTVGFIPVAGPAARAAINAGKLATKGSKFITAATKGSKAAPKVKLPQKAPKGSGIANNSTKTAPKTPKTPKGPGIVTKVEQKVSQSAIPGARNINNRFVRGAADLATSPYAVSRIVSSAMNNAAVNQASATNQPTVGFFPPLNVPMTVPIGGAPGTPGYPGPGGGGGGGTAPGTPGPDGTGGGSGGGTGTGTGSGFDPGRFRQGEERSMQLLNTGGGTAVGGGTATGGTGALPGTVQAEGLDYLAGLSGAAAASRARQYSLSDALSKDIMYGRGQAADIYGGRAPAIRGQLITGAARDYTRGLADETQQQVSEYGALERAYGRAVADAYAAEAEKIKNTAAARSSLVAQMRGIG